MPFEEERKTINLGGTLTSVSLAQALDTARLQRLSRENDRKRNKATLKLQTWWRRIRAQRIMQTQCRLVFDADPSTLIALRSLIFLHKDVDRICLWSAIMIKDDGNVIPHST
jgi:ubiquitin-protein ligase E3 C